jgi:hypothetical protein
MSSPASKPSETADPLSRIVHTMSRPLDVRALSLTGLHIVMAMRLCALFEQAGREPVPELARRFRSVEAALAMLGLVDTIATCWPEPVTVNRPCCMAMSPDEATVAAMARAATAGDSAAFGDALTGFVSAEHYEHLFEASVRAVAALQSIKPQACA